MNISQDFLVVGFNNLKVIIGFNSYFFVYVVHTNELNQKGLLFNNKLF